MKIAIIVAMQKELNLILKQMPDYKEGVAEDVVTYEGTIGEHTVVVSQCGIGKVNSALSTQKIINAIHPELVINSGVAGGVDAVMHIGDVLVADRVAYHDVWCGPGTTTGQADGCPLYFNSDLDSLRLMRVIADKPESRLRFGLLCSGDRFISKVSEVETIKHNFPEALGCDMESASIAHTCWQHNVPFVIVRVMSDMPGGGENIAEYTNFWEEAPERTFETVIEFINQL